MATLSQVQAGGSILASMLRAVAPLKAIKLADESITSLTLQNDDVLFLPLDANSAYFIVGLMVMTSANAIGTGDLKAAFTWPSGSTAVWGSVGLATSTTVTANVNAVRNTSGQTSGFGVNGGSLTSGIIIGSIQTASTAGNLQLQWAQNSGTAVTTTMKSGSTLAAFPLLT